MASIVRALRERGWRKTLRKLFIFKDDLKLGQLVGVDKFGNEYYENLECQLGALLRARVRPAALTALTARL